MRSISARSSAVSPTSATRTFSSRCSRDFAPSIGMIKAPEREPWAIGQAMESWASVAFFLRAMASSAERNRRLSSTLALPKRGSRARISSAAILRDALNRLGSADFGKVLPSHSPQAAVGATAVQQYSL